MTTEVPSSGGDVSSQDFAHTLGEPPLQACLDRVRAYHATEAYKKAYRKRSAWVEPLFAEAKQGHGMRRFRLRRLWRVNSEALMIAAGLNLKRLRKSRGWGRHPFPVEAMCAFFLAACWWLTRPSLGYGSVSSFTGSAYPLSKKEHILY